MANVDTSLHASTTGAAATYAEMHSTEHALKLYGGWFCPFVQRAWITLHEKNVPHQYVEVNPYNKTPELLALNPRGLVPTLAVPIAESIGRDLEGDQGVEHGDRHRKPLYESSVICEYIEEAYASSTVNSVTSGVKNAQFGLNLLPPMSEPYERARCRLWMDHISSKIVPGFYRVIQHTPEKDAEYTLEEARAGFLGHIKTWVREMHGFTEKPNDTGTESGDAEQDRELKEAPFFLGRELSLVDIMFAPWAKRLFLIDHYKPGGVGIPGEGEGGADEAVWKRWRVWFDAIVERESVKDTWSDDEKYIEAYKRYAEDTTQSEVAQATRKRARLP